MSKINPGKYAIYFASVLLIVAVAFASTFQRFDVFILGAGVGLVSYGFRLSTPLALLLAGIATFLGTLLPFGVSSYATIQGFEGFKNEEEDFEEEEFEEEEGKMMMGEGFDNEKEEDFEEEKEGEGFEDVKEEEFEEEEFEEEKEGEGFENEDYEEEDFEEDKPEDFDETEENFANYEGFADAGEKKKKKRKPLPDHGKRAEMFQLGKKYKMPSESDDAEFHLDAGTTFMNAYKSLKPDQISAMTTDTQELNNTQKQLKSTLLTLKPLISAGKQMMDTFQGYFGSEGMGGLGKMAENFGKA